VSGQRHAPGRFTPGEIQPVPIDRRLGGPQDQSGQARKFLPTSGFNPRTVQFVASRCTVNAIPTHGKVTRLEEKEHCKVSQYTLLIKSHYVNQIKLITLTGHVKSKKEYDKCIRRLVGKPAWKKP